MANPVLVIMAAGMGSRYGGLKQIDPIGPNGQILLDYSIYDAHRAGFDRVVFIIRPELQLRHSRTPSAKGAPLHAGGLCLSNARQSAGRPDRTGGPRRPLGTAHAVWCAKELTAGCPIAVINADDFYGADAFRKMYDYLASAQDDDKFRYCMVGYQVENTLTENGTVSRGVCTADENGLLAHIIERTPFTAMRTASSATMRTAMHPPVRLRPARRCRSTSGDHPFLPALALTRPS